MYHFETLPSGFYTITLTLPDGIVCTQSVIEYELLPNQNLTGDVTVVRTGSISGIIWQDLEGDGVWSAGKRGLVGTVISLWQSDVWHEEVITGEDGAFVFEEHLPGIYDVHVHYPSGYAASNIAETFYSVTISAVTGSPDPLLVGAIPLCSLTGYARRTDEMPVAGLNVSIDNGLEITDTQTNAVGAYTFTELRPGPYMITFELVGGMLFADSDETFQSEEILLRAPGMTRNAPQLEELCQLSGIILDMDETGVAGVLVSLTPTGLEILTDETGEYAFSNLRPGVYSVEMTLPDGYNWYPSASPILEARLNMGDHNKLPPNTAFRPASIHGHAWLDTNADGEMDSNEPNLSGARIQLWQGETLIAQTETDITGDYTFEGLLPNRYELDVTLPAGAIFTSGGLIPNIDSDNTRIPINLLMGERQTNLPIGAIMPGDLAGAFYIAKQPLQGVLVTLLSETDEAIRQVRTQADGRFWMEGLRPAVYRLHFVLPEGTLFAQGELERQMFTDPFVLDFGNQVVYPDINAIVPSRLEGIAFVDQNNNGIRDTNEPGLADVIVELRDTPWNVAAQTATGADGHFTFNTLRPGIYSLTFTWPDGYLPCDEYTVELGMGETLTGLAFGAVMPGIISGGAFIDMNADGLWGSEDFELADVLVTLTGNGQTWIQRTDEQGLYRFEDLLPADYQLHFELPADFLFTNETNASAAVTEPFPLTMGQHVEMHVGAVRVGYVGDYAWVDLDGNGLQDDDEPGLPHVKIEALRSVGDDWVLTDATETDIDGYYRLGPLKPGLYKLRVTPPMGYVPTRLVDGLPEIDSDLLPDFETRPFLLQTDQNLRNIDLGFVPAETTAAFTQQSALVCVFYNDTNWNGIYDPNEPFVAGVHAYLDVLGMDGISDETGRVLFESIPPGAYRIRYLLPQSQDEAWSELIELQYGQLYEWFCPLYGF